MLVSTLLRSWLNRRKKRQRTRPAARRPRPRVELLESRTLMNATVDGTIIPPVDPGNPGTVVPPAPGTPGQPGIGNPGVISPLLAPLVTRLYADLLHRAPAPSEVAGWVSVLAAGASPEQVAGQFTASAEYRSNLIRGDYETYLGREPSAQDLSYWVNQLNSGVSEQRVAATFLAS